MITLARIAAGSGITVSQSSIGEGGVANGSGILLMLFLGFGVLIIMCQLIPGLQLFCSRIKEFFSRPVKIQAGQK